MVSGPIAASKSLQLCPTLCGPIDSSPPGSAVLGIFQARTLESVTISFSTGPITSWQIEEEKVKVVTDFLFLSSKITVDGDCSHEIRRWLLLGRKTLTNLDSVLKRDTALLTKVYVVKAMVFLVVMCTCESWAIKKEECQRTDAFELWCWRRLLRVPWTARGSNQSILREIKSEYLLELKSLLVRWRKRVKESAWD